MNEVSQAIETAQRVNEIGVPALLFLAVLFLVFNCKNKKRMEDLIEGVKISTEQMVELNKKYQSYYEKMIGDLQKKEDRTLKIQEEILEEVKYNRDFYQKQLQGRLK